MVIIGLSGCTGAGKSTLCNALAQQTPLTVVSCDDHFLPKEQCPFFDLRALPWENANKNGVVPSAFESRGNADTNVPGSINWDGVLSDIDKVVTSSADSTAAAESNSGTSTSSTCTTTIIVDGLLLFGDHPGAQEVLERCDHCAVMWAGGEDEDAKAALRARKYTRRHLGKSSYQERGVSEAEYSVYFDHYVWPSWVTHGANRVPPGALKIDCLRLTTDEQVEILLATGWFPSLLSH